MKKRRLTSAEIADANYQQEPVDIKGKLYSEFRTYEQLPRDAAGKLDFGAIISYTDTADTGSDDLCSIVAGIHEGEGYILDVIMTDEPMEKTEPQTAEQLYSYHVETARIESNNGGRGFARNVERLLWELYQTRSVNIEWFHQGANKHARIMTGATFVMQHLLFPSDWAQRWPRYYAAMVSYQKTGKNKHDDAPDATTGIAETIQEREGRGIADYSHQHENLDIITKITAADCLEEWLGTYVNKTYKAGMYAKDIIDDLLNIFGVEVAMVKLAENKHYPGCRVCRGKLKDVLTEIACSDCKSRLVIRCGQIIINPPEEGITTGYLLTPQTGLLKSASTSESQNINTKTTATEKTRSQQAEDEGNLSRDCLLNYHIGVADKIVIRDSQTNGTFMVVSGVHEGTRSGNWKTTVEVKPA